MHDVADKLAEKDMELKLTELKEAVKSLKEIGNHLNSKS